MTALGLAALLVFLAAGAAEAAPATARIGDLLLDYNDSQWRVAMREDGATFIATACHAPGCRYAAVVGIGVGPADGPLPSTIDRGDEGRVQPLWALLGNSGGAPVFGDGPVREINGFTVFATDRWSGCRAMSASELTAILDHRGHRYAFRSGVAMGCGGVWGVPREVFVDLLAGLRPAP